MTIVMITPPSYDHARHRGVRCEINVTRWLAEVHESEKKREQANDTALCGGVTAKEVEQANATREKKTESEGGGSSGSSGNQDDSGFSQSDYK